MGTVFERLEDVDIAGDKFTAPLPLGPEGAVLHGVLSNGLRRVPAPLHMRANCLIWVLQSIPEPWWACVDQKATHIRIECNGHVVLSHALSDRCCPARTSLL